MLTSRGSTFDLAKFATKIILSIYERLCLDQNFVSQIRALFTNDEHNVDVENYPYQPYEGKIYTYLPLSSYYARKINDFLVLN